MITLGKSDFLLLSQFELRWRFVDRKYSVLPDGALLDMHPLTSSTAEALGPLMADVCRHKERSEEIKIAALCESPGDAERTRRELTLLRIADVDRVIVSWSNSCALETSWRTFRTYWDDFCYPGSDDVTIYPVMERWVLCYCHDEMFVFRQIAV